MHGQITGRWFRVSTQQLTLKGDETDAERIRPSTFVWCEDCEAAVYRGEDHEHDLSGMAAYEKAQIQLLEEKIPEHARVETQQWVVEFHYTAVEQVVVEASDKLEAREHAREARAYDPEILDTVHVDRRARGEPSPASIEYLELVGLLPEDHDVTQEELEQVMEACR